MEAKHEENNLYSNNIDVIPAFLTTDHLTNHKDRSEENNMYPSHTNIYDEHASDMVVRERLHYALELGHIDVFMQPIVTLPQRHVAFYEFLGRLRVKAGQYVAAQDYMALANEERIVSNLDTILLTECLKILKKQKNKVDRSISYFININPFTLRNQVFMKNLVTILSKHRDIAYSLIFEMHHNDFLMLSPAEKKILGELSKVGCRFSIDHVKEIPKDIEQLSAYNVSFIKINAEILISEGEDKANFAELISNKQRLNDHNINLIIEKIESESMIVELLDYNIKYGQGFLFGKPDFSGVYT